MKTVLERDPERWPSCCGRRPPPRTIAARVQGHGRTTAARGALPGTTVTLRNDATGVVGRRASPTRTAATSSTSSSRACYTVVAELPGFKTTEQQNVRVQQRADLTVDLVLAVGGIEETGGRSQAAPVAGAVQQRQRRPHARAAAHRPGADRRPQSVQPGVARSRRITVSPATSENRPYHHAYANDYDAGGGTRRANDVLLDGVRARRQLQDRLHAGRWTRWKR